MQTIGVVGRSRELEVFARICERNGVEPLFWESEEGECLPENVRRVELRELSDTPLIFFLEPIETARVMARRLGDVISGRHVVVHTSRELEQQTLATMSTILREETSTHRIGFMTGPMRAVDIERGLSASATVYSRFPEVHEMLVSALVSPTFRLYRSDELASAEIAAAYTRVIAFVWGVAHAMSQGGSVGATLFARGLAEIARVVEASGGAQQAVFGMSGAGNLFADVQEPFSADVMLGREAVVRGNFEVEQMIELFGDVAKSLYDLIGGLDRHCELAGIEGRIAKAALSMVSHEMDTVQAAKYLMTLPVLDE